MDCSTGDRAQRGLPMTSARPRPSSVPAGAHASGRNAEPLPSRSAEGGVTAPSESMASGELLSVTVENCAVLPVEKCAV